MILIRTCKIRIFRSIFVDFAHFVCYSLDELKENLQKKVYKRDDHANDRKRWLKKCFDNRTMNDTIQALLR